MFHTPGLDKRKMVKTRGARAREMAEASGHQTLQKEHHQTRSEIVETSNQIKIVPSEKPKTEGSFKLHHDHSIVASSSKNSKRSSLEARKKQLEYEAALATAELEQQLIENKKMLIQKKAAAEIAALDEELSLNKSQCSEEHSVKEKVEQWLEHSRIDAQELTCDQQQNMAADAAAPNDILHLARALENLSRSTTNNNTQLLSRLAMPKDLPLYYGDSLEWMQFKKVYFSSNKICSYTDPENIARLNKCLRGEAKEAVSALLFSDASPDTIIEALELRFGRPEIIIAKMSAQIKKIPPLPQAFHTEIVNFSIKIKNFVCAAQSIQQTDFIRSPDLLNTVLSKCPTVLITKWTDFAYLNQDASKAKLELFSDFLHNEAKRTAAVGATYINNNYVEQRKKPEEKRYNPQQTVLIQSKSEDIDNQCAFCRSKSPHKITDCIRFKKALRKDRWRFVTARRLCHKCLISRHHKSSCPAPSCGVDDCELLHHPLLHWPVKKDEQISAKNSEINSAEKENAESEMVNSAVSETVAHSSHTSTSASRVLLKVVKIKLHGPTGTVVTHALLDDGATVSLISAEIANRVGLSGEKENIRIKGAWNSSELKCQTEIVNIKISNSENNMFTLNARKVNELDLPKQALSCVKISDFEHLVPLTNQLCYEDVKPAVLIGQDNYHLILPKQTVIRCNSEPCATLTPLGWCIHGNVPVSICQPTSSTTLSLSQHPINSDYAMDTNRPNNSDQLLSVLLLTESPSSQCDIAADDRLHELVRQSFAFEAIGVHHSPRKNPEEELAVQIVDQSAIYNNGKWEVGLPWKPEYTKMEESLPNAHRRLLNIEKKLAQNPESAARYKERIKYLFDNDYARPITKDEPPPRRSWYLPHFGVDNPNKKKLRLVYDAAAKSNGMSLNDYLLQGPDLLQPLLGVMFRFREGPIGITGDIKDMFLRIKIIPEDQHALKFLWRESMSESVNHFAMTSLIFGANCSPFIAQHIKNKNAMRFETLMPEAVTAIIQNHYMDDYIDSFHDVPSAIKTMNDVTDIHAQGNFEIRNWSSNKPEICANARKETLSASAIRLNIDNESERTLGLLWYPSTDTIGFDLTLKRIPNNILMGEIIPTKRQVLKIVMSIYDVYGLLAPFTMQAKILLQSIWKTQIDWDDKISQQHFSIFKDWLKQLIKIKDIKIPRWYFNQESLKGDGNSCGSSSATETIELHLFCDASPTGYAAVAYWRRITDNGCVYVSFIASKCRVAPIKFVSIARLELQSGVLACRLANTIKKEHRIKCDKTYFWTDSQIVIHWIKNTTRSYKVFVANRLGEIDDLSSPNDWNYVPTTINIADVATKQNNYCLSNDCTWFAGPQFLHEVPLSCSPSVPEKEKRKINEDQLETVHTVYLPTNDLPVPDATRFSSWLRLTRAAANVLLFIELCRKNTDKKQMTADLMSRAESLLFKSAQFDSFSADIKSLQQCKQTPKDSQLRSLTPFIDANGLLRVGGRIEAAKDVSQQMKQPVILDGRHPLARLIVKHYHTRAAHGHNEMVVNELRQRYWILRLRPTVRTVASRCVFCRIRKALPSPPLMGVLPEARLSHHNRPFTFCGVDLFSSMQVTIGRRREQRYGVLFTCLTIRAIHIELVPSLSADSFIMALRRMAARRGWPAHMYSDNGTNFHGAKTELHRAYLEKKVQDEVANMKMTWSFISPASPHMGGSWERQIRTVKTALRVILNERAPREETLITLLAEVENLVNSKPLTHVSVRNDDDETLTANHFLIGGSSNLPIPGKFDNRDLYLRKQWRIAQRLTDMFWARWIREILPTLIPRQKWQVDQKPIEIGDVVLIVDPQAPRNTWLKGRIQQVYPGKDGRIRVVDVKTKTGCLRRPMAKIVRLPTKDEECFERNTGGEKCSLPK